MNLNNQTTSKMKKLVSLCLFFGMFIYLNGQQMSWVPSKYVRDAACVDQTDCGDNMVCYKLQYKPSHDGVLTSYTTGFLVNCNDKVSNVKLNSSCKMQDNSTQILACESEGLIMLNCSGNSGTIDVVENQPVFLHQICVQFDGKAEDLKIQESEIVELTSSIDMADGNSITEYSKYQDFIMMNSQVFCHSTEDNLFLDAELDQEGLVSLEWEPAREVEGGVYKLWQSENGSSYDLLEVYESKLISHQNAFKYSHELKLEDFGDHVFKVTYSGNDVEERASNMAEVYYKDVQFTLHVTPNPTSDQVNVLVTSAEEQVTVRIVNMNGQQVRSSLIKTEKEEQIELRDLVPGLYTVTVSSGNEILSEKLIVID